MADRWVLERAGIVNVYQYGEETLRFGGGRLLLRGVNGSGKSTAMNMLLPFLLDADTRRIDAAGEQAGVLRSWMLSGREEQQPVGYLWIEFRRGDEHVTCGCGIRANRSTEKVTTWWFVTPRRPGIDLAVVENRTPKGIDALRAELGPDAVFAENQRPAYRAEVRRRLFGGRDLDQHLRLLHVVRNPRVGDRIDLDLANYLHDALPQLSEGALDDAAQPLEDLEEHRRNVDDLTRTTSSLEALDGVYRAYARSELHRRMGEADALAHQAVAREREVADVRARQARAEAERAQAATTIERWEEDVRRLGQEIDTLKSREAYQAGEDLTQRREHLTSLDRQVSALVTELEIRVQRRSMARAGVENARGDAESDLDVLGEGLHELAELSLAAGLSVRPPDRLHIKTVSRPPEGLEVPAGGADVDPSRRGIADVRVGAHHRRDDVQEVRAALAKVDQALRLVDDAEHRVAEAETTERDELEALAAARAASRASVERWRDALVDWRDRLHQHRLTQGLGDDADPLTTSDLAGERVSITAAFVELAEATVEYHHQLGAELRAHRKADEAQVAECRLRLTELQARLLPDPPSAAWQRPGRGRCLAELVDFRADIGPEARAGLEAAMEGAGLLGAEVSDDGSVVLADGQLVAWGGTPVEQPLSDLLTVTAEAAHREPVDHVVAGVLEAISTRSEDLGGLGGPTVVTADGHFRIGVLRGRHAKAGAEHIGVTARRAALERQQEAAAALLGDAERALAATSTELARREALAREAVEIRRALPSDRPVAEALLATEHGARLVERARQRLGEHRRRLQSDEVTYGQAVDASRRSASTLGLPHDPRGLERIGDVLGDVTRSCDFLGHRLTALARSVDRWLQEAERWDQAVEDEAASRDALKGLEREREPVATTLATLERTVGAEYDEIVLELERCGHDLGQASNELEKARADHLGAHGTVERLASEAEGAAARLQHAQDDCVAALPHLRRALAVPGLLAAAVPPAAAADRSGAGDEKRPIGTASPLALPAVAATPRGLAELAVAVKAMIPASEATPVGADSVRQSLRQRRDALGAGWDAEDRQPDETLPLHIEVTGPLGRMPLSDATTRAHEQLDRMASLLSAKQDQALRNLLQGLIAREVAEKLHAATELVGLMNQRLHAVSTSQGIGVSLRWKRRDDLDAGLAGTVDLLAKPPDLRSAEEDQALTAALSERIAEARRDEPDAPYRQLVGQVLDYRTWHKMSLILRRPGRDDERLTRRTALSEGEKKMVSYLPLFAAVAASCDALAEAEPSAPRFVLLDDAFAKVSEDNHAKLFGLLVELDLDFIATSERLWGTHASVPELAITEVLRDAELGVIALEHSRWDGSQRTEAT